MTTNGRAPKRGQTGFSIVELLVAIALGGILMTGAISLFVNNRDMSRMTTDIARMQETARFAMEMILNDARMAGYFGCVNNMDADVFKSHVTVDNAGELWDTTNPIEGFEADDTQWYPSGFTHGGTLIGTTGDDGLMLAGTDAITFRYLSGTFAADAGLDETPYAEIVASTASTVTANDLDGAGDFATKDIAGVSDCGGVDIFIVGARAGDTLTMFDSDGGVFARPYEPTNGPMVAPLVARRYYIGRNTRGNPALYREVIDYPASGADDYEVANRELLEGVENMQILYGLDRDDNGTPDFYTQAGSTELDEDLEWLDVVSVKVALLVRSANEHRFGESETVIRDRTYDLLDEADLTFNDLRRRRQFTSTALLRNLQ